MPPPASGATTRPVPFAVPEIAADDIDAVVAVLRSNWLTTGPECVALEAELAEYLGVPHAIAVSSCTAALEIAYAALRLPRGSRVGVPTWTFVSTALSFVHHGGLPVLLDVDEDTLNVDPRSLRAALEKGLDALVIVHFGGVPVDPAVFELAQEAGVPVIEDAAHALGAVDGRGRVAGRGNVAGCLSFYATKNLTAAEGGALTTERDDIAEFARSFRLHGLSRDAWARYLPGGQSHYELIAPGIKANLPDMLAALARSQLRRFDEMQHRRRLAVERYRSNLAGVADLETLPARLVENGADHLFVVKLPRSADRDTVQARLTAEGIASSVHFRPLHTFEWFAINAEVGPSGTRVADALRDRVLSLPLYPGLSVEQVDYVCDALQRALS